MNQGFVMRRCSLAFMTSVLVFGLLLLDAKSLTLSAARRSPENPLRSISATIGEHQQRQFFEQLRRFADANAFAIRVAPSTPDGKTVLIQMWRSDVKVIGDNAIKPAEFHISFYQNHVERPTAASLDGLASDLKKQSARSMGYLSETWTRHN